MEQQQIAVNTGASLDTMPFALAFSDAGQPGKQWVQLMPAPHLIPNDGRKPWHISHIDQVIANSLAYAGSRKIPIDYDHQIDKSQVNGQPSIAAGWVEQLEARDGGIWGLVEWTDKASSHIAAKEFRYISPVFNFTPEREVTRILRAALLNNPALDMTALSHSMPADAELAELRGLLGLADSADFASIKQAVAGLASAACGGGNMVPAEQLQQALAASEALKKEAEETALAASVDQAISQAHILPHHREFALALCRQDKGLFDQFVASISPFLGALRGMQSHGKELEKLVSSKINGPLNEAEQAICQAMGHSAQEFTQLGVSNDR